MSAVAVVMYCDVLLCGAVCMVPSALCSSDLLLNSTFVFAPYLSSLFGSSSL